VIWICYIDEGQLTSFSNQWQREGLNASLNTVNISTKHYYLMLKEVYGRPVFLS